MRESADATKVNRPRLIAGLEWKLAVVLVVFFGFAALTTRNLYIGALGVAVLLFLAGAGRRDPLFLRVYLRHAKQASRYSPAPVVCRPLRNTRPVGYGWRDPK